MIVLFVTGFDRTQVFRDNPVIRERERKEIDRILMRRSRHEPLQYIVGEVGFYGLQISVGPGVLIPRPETELLVEEVIKEWSGERGEGTNRCTEREGFSILDLCTGSGCIALALAKAFPRARVVGSDLSKTAVIYARRNAKRNGIGNATFLRGDLFEPVEERNFHCIVSNPPYITTSAMRELPEEIREWEPEEALHGGTDGLDYYRRIMAGLKEYLRHEGRCYLEIGHDQKRALEGLSRGYGFTVECKKDYSGHDRIAILSISSAPVLE